MKKPKICINNTCPYCFSKLDLVSDMRLESRCCVLYDRSKYVIILGRFGPEICYISLFSKKWYRLTIDNSRKSITLRNLEDYKTILDYDKKYELDYNNILESVNKLLNRLLMIQTFK